MYGSDPKYLAEVRNICSTLVEEILSHLKTLNTPEVPFFSIFNYMSCFMTKLFYAVCKQQIGACQPAHLCNLISMLFAAQIVNYLHLLYPQF